MYHISGDKPGVRIGEHVLVSESFSFVHASEMLLKPGGKVGVVVLSLICAPDLQ